MVTVAARKALAISALEAGSRAMMADLRIYATTHGVHFRVFGSVA